MKFRLGWAVLVVCVGLSEGCDSGGSKDGGSDGGPPGAGFDAGSDVDAGADAGSDAGSDVDAGSDAGSGACPYAFCEDFDSLDAGVITNGMLVGPWKASVSGPMTVMQIDSENAHSGNHALHVTMVGEQATDAGLPSRATLNRHTSGGAPLVAGNDMFGRAEIFFSDAGTSGLAYGTHSWMFSSLGTKPDGGTSNINLGGGGQKLQFNYHAFADGGEQSVQGGLVTAGAWHCLQWELNGSGGASPADIAKVWIDGTLAVDVEMKPGWAFPSAWTTFDFGFNHYQVLHNPVDVYLDDFALNGAMIPCP